MARRRKRLAGAAPERRWSGEVEKRSRWSGEADKNLAEVARLVGGDGAPRPNYTSGVLNLGDRTKNAGGRSTE